MIPEGAVSTLSVTTRAPRRFTNKLGDFIYRHIKQEAFFGYRAADVQGRKVFLADPEKALLDLWYLERGEWTRDRMIEMRFQNFDSVEEEKLVRYATRFASPRLMRAVETWKELSAQDREETVPL
jgi:predicted transcriptional regulator of viral defense system